MTVCIIANSHSPPNRYIFSACTTPRAYLDRQDIFNHIHLRSYPLRNMADLSTCLRLTRDSVRQAQELIKGHIHFTPVLTNATLTQLASTPRSPSDLEGTNWAGRTPAKPTIRLWFKCENLQRGGAFKVRGAFHAVERLKQDKSWVEGGGFKKGVLTHSSGRFRILISLI